MNAEIDFCWSQPPCDPTRTRESGMEASRFHCQFRGFGVGAQNTHRLIRFMSHPLRWGERFEKTRNGTVTKSHAEEIRELSSVNGYYTPS